MTMTTLPPTEERWQAVQTNDAAYDGVFVYAVTTTGIYCRPSCTSRPPNPHNVRYYDSPCLAEAEGYRPCKRCQPAQPANEAEIITQMCLELAEVNPPSFDVIARQHFLSPGHARRLFKRVLGITPAQYARACRSERFREQLRAGVPVTSAIYEAGYGSPSRVYENLDDALGMTPRTYQLGGQAQTILYTIVPCALGHLLVASTRRGVCRLSLSDDPAALEDKLKAEFPQAELVREDEMLAEVVTPVLAYLQGWQPHLDLPLDVQATAFQQRVYNALRAIPYGQTRTYAQIAEAIGQPQAARAVGNACASNPVPLVVPCHRVVPTTGGVGGYALGPERKVHLLAMEREQAGDP